MSLKYESARKFLELIRHLHLQGYEQLRIVPYVRDGSSPIWVCDVAAATDVRNDHGGLTPNLEHGPGFFSVRHVPNSPWPGFVEQSLDEAARCFVEQEPETAGKAFGADADYVRWYEEMLALTAPVGLVASEVYWEQPPNRMCVFNVKNLETVHVPLPPPGLANRDP